MICEEPNSTADLHTHTHTSTQKTQSKETLIPYIFHYQHNFIKKGDKAKNLNHLSCDLKCVVEKKERKNFM